MRKIFIFICSIFYLLFLCLRWLFSSYKQCPHCGAFSSPFEYYRRHCDQCHWDYRTNSINKSMSVIGKNPTFKKRFNRKYKINNKYKFK